MSKLVGEKMINTLFSMGLVNSAAELADDSNHAVKNANKATNLKLPKKQRKQARKDFIKNVVNVGAPVAVGAIVGTSTYGTAAIPAAQITQQLVKASGIGSVMGEIFQPLLAPFANILGFCKKKIKDHLKIDLEKCIDVGTNVASPIIGATKTVTGNPLVSMMDGQLFKGAPSSKGLEIASSVLEHKNKVLIPSAIRAMSTKSFKPKVSSFMPSVESAKRYTKGIF
jgi:hypothetical protein